MSKLDEIRANAERTRKEKNERARAFDKIKTGLEEALAVSKGEAKPAKVTVFKRGRPLAKNAAKSLTKTKPWLLEGMSRASWYRRKGASK